MSISEHSLVDGETLQLGQYFKTIRRFIWRILGLSIAVSVLALLLVLSLTPRYTSKASLLIEAEQANVLSIEEIYGLDSSRKEYFQTQYEILRSRKIAALVVDKLNLTEQPSFDLELALANQNIVVSTLKSIKRGLVSALPFLPQNQQVPNEQEIQQAKYKFAVDTLMENLTIKPLVNTQVVDILYINEDPKLAAAIANTVADVYIESYLQSKLDMTAKATSWLNTSLQGLRTKLNNAETALAEFDEQEQLVNVDGVVSLVSDELQKLNNQLIEAQVELQRNQAIYDQVNQRGTSVEQLATLPDVLNHPSIQSVKREEVLAQSRVSELQEVYGPKHPIMIAANAELNSLHNSLRGQINNLVSGINNEYNASKTKVSGLEREISQAKVKFRELSNLENKRRSLQRDVDINQQLYDSFFTRLKETDQLGGFESANARILDAAIPSQYPSEPRVLIIVIGIFVLAFLSGCGLALTIEALNNGIRSVDDVEQKLSQRMLGIVPWQAHKNTENLPLRHFFDPDNHIFGESLRTLRTSIQLLNVDKQVQTMVVTSTVPKEGKSTVATNLSFVIGQMSSVLLIDADLRRPSIASRFELPGYQPGLSNLIAGTHTLEQCIVQDKESGIDLLCAGTVPPNPQELLASERFAQLMTELRQKYEQIVLDTAPTNAVSDAMIVAKQCDSVVYVVKADSTSTKQINNGLNRFLQIGNRVDGIVLNQVDLNKAHRSTEYSGFYDQYGYASYKPYQS